MATHLNIKGNEIRFIHSFAIYHDLRSTSDAMFFNTLLPPFPFIYSKYIFQFNGRKEGRKDIFHITTHSTHFIYCSYGVMDMVKEHSYSERGS